MTLVSFRPHTIILLAAQTERARAATSAARALLTAAIGAQSIALIEAALAAFDALGDDIVDDEDADASAAEGQADQPARQSIEEIAQSALDLCAALERAAMGEQAQRQHAMQVRRHRER